MPNKQTQGDNRQRRKAAKEAREAGAAPSEVGATTGASKQRRHRQASAPHEERVDDIRRGKLPSAGQGRPNVRPASGRPKQQPQ